MSIAKASVIVGALRRLPAEQAGEVETVLLQVAGHLDATLLTRAARHAVRIALEQTEPGRLDALTEARRELHVSPTLDGSVLVHGTLTPSCGEALLSALASLATPAPATADGRDSRSPAQRRHDALEELCRLALDSGALPQLGGNRPHVNVTVDLYDLRAPGTPRPDDVAARAHTGTPAPPPRGHERARSGSCRFAWTGAASALDARVTACDATVSRVVLDRLPLDSLAAAITDYLPAALAGSPRQVLDIGRATRLVSPALRKALVARDQGCSHPGCAVPAAYCEAHHIQHWADGGPTTLANLTLHCRRHHRAAHQDHDWHSRHARAPA